MFAANIPNNAYLEQFIKAFVFSGKIKEAVSEPLSLRCRQSVILPNKRASEGLKWDYWLLYSTDSTAQLNLCLKQPLKWH